MSTGDTIEYTYDSFNRLVEEVNCAFGQRTIITYDKGGNIVEKSTARCNNGGSSTITFAYTNPWKDQLTSIGGQPIVYDAIGNPLTYKGNTLYWTRGRLLDAYGNKACYTYNSAGIRVEKCVKSVPTKYIVSGSTILAETTGNTKIVYYHSAEGVIGFNHNGVDYYYRKNLQGDIIAIVNTSGGIVAKYVYDAWGNHKIYSSANTLIYDSQNPSSANSSHIGCINPFRYRSYYFDSETGLYYLNSRYYDPQVCRFLNADSIDYLEPEKLQGLNLYSYCANNPVMYVDPTGHEIWHTILMVLGSVVEIVAGIAFIVAGDLPHGLGLIGTGASSIISGIISENSGGTFAAGWGSSQIGGILTTITGSAFLGGFAGTVFSDLFSWGITEKTFSNALLTAFLASVLDIGVVFGKELLQGQSTLLTNVIAGVRNLLSTALNTLFSSYFGRK